VPRIAVLLLNTLLLTGATCAVSLPLGTAVAWLLVRTDLPLRRMGLGLAALLLFVPLYLQAAAWQAGFALQGWYTLASAGGPLLDGWTGAVWVHAAAALPWVVLLVGAGWRWVEPELEEQALLDGSPRQVFLHVTLRGTWPALAMAAIWIAIVTAGEMTVTDLFGVRTYAEEVYTQIAVGEEPGVAAVGLVPGVLATALLVAAAVASASALGVPDRPGTPRRPLCFPLGRWRWPLGLLAVAVALAMIGVPLGSLFYKAGVVVSQTAAGRVRAWSAAKCLWMIFDAPRRFAREFGWTFLVCTLAATTAVAAATPLAWLARRSPCGDHASHGALPAMLVAAVCLAVPGPVLGLLVIWGLDRPEIPWLFYLYDHSILAPWLALWIRAMPVAIFCLWHALGTVPAAVLESAAIDGAGRAVLWRRIILPLRWPAFAVAWLLALAVALGDLSASVLVVPPGVTTIAIRIFGLLHYGVDDQVAGLCLALLGLVALVAAAAWAILPFAPLPLASRRSERIQ
jgi:iron(III) transport system permease protein